MTGVERRTAAPTQTRCSFRSRTLRTAGAKPSQPVLLAAIPLPPGSWCRPRSELISCPQNADCGVMLTEDRSLTLSGVSDMGCNLEDDLFVSH